MIQIAALFLVGMVVLALVTRFRRPPQRPRALAQPCTRCGRLTPSTQTCPCGRPPITRS